MARCSSIHRHKSPRRRGRRRWHPKWLSTAAAARGSLWRRHHHRRCCLHGGRDHRRHRCGDGSDAAGRGAKRGIHASESVSSLRHQGGGVGVVGRRRAVREKHQKPYQAFGFVSGGVENGLRASGVEVAPSLFTPLKVLHLSHNSDDRIKGCRRRIQGCRVSGQERDEELRVLFPRGLALAHNFAEIGPSLPDSFRIVQRLRHLRHELLKRIPPIMREAPGHRLPRDRRYNRICLHRHRRLHCSCGFCWPWRGRQLGHGRNEVAVGDHGIGNGAELLQHLHALGDAPAAAARNHRGIGRGQLDSDPLRAARLERSVQALQENLHRSNVAQGRGLLAILAAESLPRVRPPLNHVGAGDGKHIDKATACFAS
mmetsp:Transcript_60426/g.153551  ORF Transcript_60426/g.153551 Transcript_60426/m.153551 type:complete len:370 (+) Transcript_60426:87-1196(+)